MNHFHRTMACIITITILPTTANADFTFRQVARTGGDTIPGLSTPVVSFGHWVSINDAGQVAFKVKLRVDCLAIPHLADCEAIVRASRDADGQYDLSNPDLWHIVATGDGDLVRFGDYVSINKGGKVCYRRRSSGAGVIFHIMCDDTSIARAAAIDSQNHYFKGLMAPVDVNDQGMVSFYGSVLDGIQIRNQIRIGDGSTPWTDRVRGTRLVASQPAFGGFNQWTSINNAGWVVFTGSHPTEGTGAFVGVGGNADTPGYHEVVASTSDFSVIGTRPSINSHNQVAFYGHRQTGEEGIYVRDNGGTPQFRIPVVAPLTGILPDSRVAINDDGDLAFMMTVSGDPADVPALARFFGGDADIVVKVGDSINGGEPTQAIELWDGFNKNGKLAFWAQHGGTEGIYVSDPPFAIIDPNPGDRAYPTLLDDAVVTTDLSKLGADSVKLVNGLAADGVTPVVLKVALNGPGQVFFTITDENDVQAEVGTLHSLGGSPGSTTLTVPARQLPTNEWAAFAILTAPIDFCRVGNTDDESIDQRPIKAQAEFTPNGAPAPTRIFSRAIELHRPPVMLLHGMWSSMSCWDWPQFADDGSQTRFIVHRANYELKNASRLYVNARVTRDGITSALANVRKSQVAATQADVVGHSMGGLLARLYIAADTTYKRQDNFMAGDIHKLITLDTPHTGSPLANAFVLFAAVNPVAARVISSVAQVIFGGQTFCIDCGCMDDMADGSIILSYLPPVSVPAHAIIGTGGSDLVQWSLLPAPILAVFTELDAFNFHFETSFPPGLQHDLIVGRGSQAGRLATEYTTVVGVAQGYLPMDTIHFAAGFPIGVTKSEQVGDRVVELLNAGVHDVPFAAGFPGAAFLFDTPLDAKPPVAQTTQRLQFANGVEITYPVSGTPVTPGSVIHVGVEAREGFAANRVLVVSSGDAQIDDELPFDVPILIPANAIGQIMLYAFGFDAADDVADSEEVLLPVDVSATLTQISVEPRTLWLFSFSPQGAVSVLGHYDDGVDRDLTRSAFGTTYATSDPTIATVDSEGLVTPHSVGTTTLSAVNQGLTDSVKIMVMSTRSDFDSDGDVDLADFGVLQRCYSGDVSSPLFTLPGVECRDTFDCDNDSDVDIVDFATFELRLGGPK